MNETDADDQKLVARVEALLEHVKYPEYTFVVRTGHGGVFLQAHYEEADSITGAPATQYTRKWLLSPFMTDSELVFTAFKLCLTSTEHRTREFFTYKGERVASPHLDVEDLVTLCRAGRADAGSRKPS